MSDAGLADRLTECRIELVLFEDEIFITQMKISKMLEWLVISEKYVDRISHSSAYKVISDAIESGNNVISNLRDIQKTNVAKRDSVSRELMEIELKLKNGLL
jgi:hypothetical protein